MKGTRPLTTEYERLLTCIRDLAMDMETKSKHDRCGYFTKKGACTFRGSCHNWIEGKGCSRHKK